MIVYIIIKLWLLLVAVWFYFNHKDILDGMIKTVYGMFVLWMFLLTFSH